MNEDKNTRLLPRILAFLTTLALVLGAVFLVANWQKLNFDSLKRWAAYRSLVRNDAGQVEAFSYDGGSDGAFARVGDDLLAVSQTGIRLYSPSGGAYLDDTCRLERPIAVAVGNSALVYDMGGKELYVYRDRARSFAYTAPDDGVILSASLSAQGRLALVTQSTGFKGVVTVYDEQFQTIVRVKLSSRFITDAILSPDGSALAVITAGQTQGVFDSQVSFYSLPRTREDGQPDAVYTLNTGAVLALNWTSGPLRVLGESALELVNADGSLAGSYAYGDNCLKGFSLGGDVCVLLLGRYRAATAARLVCVDNAGQEQAALSVYEQVLSLSAAGRYAALLSPDALYIYDTGSLAVYHTLEDTQGARRVLQRPDGSVTLIAEETARLYLPD